MKGNFIFAVLASIILMAASCTEKEQQEPQAIHVKSVSFENIEDDAVSMVEGDSRLLEVSVLPEDADNRKYVIESSDEEVAVVDEEDRLTAVAPGGATITVTTEDGGKKASFELTVARREIHIESVSFSNIGDEGTVMLAEGETRQLEWAFVPENPDNENVIFTTSDNGYVTVSDAGLITAVKETPADAPVAVTLTTEDGQKTAVVEVTVLHKVINVESIAFEGIDGGKIILKPNETADLTVKVLPENADDKTYSWSNSDQDVVRVNETGRIRALKVGEATITVTSTDGGKTASVTVEVVPVLVENISIDADVKSFDFSANPDPEASPIKIEIVPTDATDKSLVWTTSDKYVAYADEAGNIVPVGHGKAVITATAKDGSGKSAELAVTVNGVKDLNYGKGDTYYDKLYYPVNITVINDAGETVTQTWLDRNLGASALPAKAGDPDAAGSYFQWSRKADGHEQLKTNWHWTTKYECEVNLEDEPNKTTSSRTNYSSNKFIWLEGTSVPNDWAREDLTDRMGLWGGGDFKNSVPDTDYSAPLEDSRQANNPCPAGYRVPTANELFDMFESMTGVTIANGGTATYEGAETINELLWKSDMKIVSAGYIEKNGTPVGFSGQGSYWAATTGASDVSACRVFFKNATSSNIVASPYHRIRGCSVRCIRDTALETTDIQ